MLTHCSRCGAPLTLVDEVLDVDGLYVGRLTCPCGRKYLDTRHAHIARPAPPKGFPSMRFIDLDRVCTYLDGVGLRLDKGKDQAEIKVVDLTLRVQPFTAALAKALDPDVKALLFSMNDATPKPKLKAVALTLSIPKQHIDVALLPDEGETQIGLMDVAITDCRVRTEKGVEGFALIFRATFGPVGRDELEYVTNWYTQARFLTFAPAQPPLPLEAKQPAPAEDDAAVRHTPRGLRGTKGRGAAAAH